MQVRSHVVAVATVKYVARTAEPHPGGEMHITGTAQMEDQVVVLVPDEGRERYLDAFLETKYGHWGLIDGKRFVRGLTVFHRLDGAIVRQTY